MEATAKNFSERQVDNLTNCPETSLQQEILNANFIRNEEKATNEEAIKDVWDAQSILTEALQILSDFYAKVIQSDFARLESETTEAEFEVGSIFDEFTGKAVERCLG